MILLQNAQYCSKINRTTTLQQVTCTQRMSNVDVRQKKTSIILETFLRQNISLAKIMLIRAHNVNDIHNKLSSKSENIQLTV